MHKKFKKMKGPLFFEIVTASVRLGDWVTRGFYYKTLMFDLLFNLGYKYLQYQFLLFFKRRSFPLIRDINLNHGVPLIKIKTLGAQYNDHDFTHGHN